MIYGAYGYSGRLIAAEAARRGHRPILAGRSESQLRALATELDLTWRCVALDDRDAIRHALVGVDLLLNVAGPFGATCPPLLDVCIELGTSYADISGELDMYEQAFARDDDARRA